MVLPTNRTLSILPNENNRDAGGDKRKSVMCTLSHVVTVGNHFFKPRAQKPDEHP